jgi:hypothetical protein
MYTFLTSSPPPRRYAEADNLFIVNVGDMFGFKWVNYEWILDK